MRADAHDFVTTSRDVDDEEVEDDVVPKEIKLEGRHCGADIVPFPEAEATLGHGYAHGKSMGSVYCVTDTDSHGY